MADNMRSLKRRLSSLDAAFLYLESNSSPTHVGGMSVFEGEMSFEKYFRFLEERIHLVPRYRQRLAEVPFNLAHATLEDDPDFKLENHVKRHRLRPGISEPEVIEEALRVYEPRLDRSRPLWENHLLEGFKDRTVIVQKIHHALVDGVSTVEMSVIMSDFSPTPNKIEPPAKPWQPAPLPGQGERLVSAIRDLLLNQVGTASRNLLELIREPYGVGRADARHGGGNASDGGIDGAADRADALAGGRGRPAALLRALSSALRRLSSDPQRLRGHRQRRRVDGPDRRRGALLETSWMAAAGQQIPPRMSGQRTSTRGEDRPRQSRVDDVPDDAR